MDNHCDLVEKAGAIILNKDGTKAVLLYRGKPGDWVFPKGHVEAGENPLRAMFREIKEETGVTGKVLRSLPDMKYRNYKGEDVRLHMYLLCSETEQLTKEFPEDKVEWVNLDAVAERLTHQNLKDYFLQQLPGIRKN